MGYQQRLELIIWLVYRRNLSCLGCCVGVSMREYPPRTTRPARPYGLLFKMGRMKKWEYATAPVLTHATKQILDSWGEDGWELVSITPGMNPENVVAYFKREVE